MGKQQQPANNITPKNSGPKNIDKTIVLIPARMAATRLPGKPLADLHGRPMIVHVWQRAVQANIGRVVVAVAEQEIANVIRQNGGEVVQTDPNLPSGSDRIYAALQQIDPQKDYQIVLNLQGDLPTIDPKALKQAVQLMEEPHIDIATLGVKIVKEDDLHNTNIVKIAADIPAGYKRGRAVYFSRLPVPYGEGDYYHHIGIYCYRRLALQRFVAAAPTPLEKREKLEQLRALSLGLYIGVQIVDTLPLSVDTPADLQQARRLLKGENIF